MSGGAEIAGIIKNSIAEEIALSPGDRLLAINGEPLSDLIDYRLLSVEENIELEIIKQSGEKVIFEIEKDPEEELGIVFRSATFDKLAECKNRCVFCFVDQMPPDLRPTLYVKDDDYRHSFLHGNFITLTNLSESEIQRIVALHLSPLYISVHTTNSQLRVKMLRNRQAGKIMELLNELAAHGIEMHTQAVLCPGWNDGQELERSIKDLKKLWPQVGSLAVVPVGLTRYRDKLQPIDGYSCEQAGEVLKQVLCWQNKMLEELGSRFVFAADEFYLKAKQPLPAYEEYEDFPQLENGVGLTRMFEKECADELQKSKGFCGSNKEKIVIITGTSAASILERIIQEIILKFPRLQIEVMPVVNNFFGKSVSVAGLVTGADILLTMTGRTNNKGKEKFFLPEVMLREGEAVFLDGMKLQELEVKSNSLIEIIPVNGKAFIKGLLENIS